MCHALIERRFVPLVPILGIVVCFAMMASLDMATWIRLVVWLVIGLVDLLHLQPLQQPSGDGPERYAE